MRAPIALVRIASAWCSAALVLLPVLALAGEIDAKQARTYVELGTELFRAAEYQRALDEFRRAEPLGDALGERARAGIRYNIARCLEELGRADEAVVAFERYLELEDDPKVQAVARQKLAALLARSYAGLLVRCDLPKVTVEIASTGMEPRTCPASWARVSAGWHDLTFRLGRTAIGTERVEVVAGKKNEIQVDRGLVQVRASDGGAAVYVSGKKIGATPLEILLPTGSHRLEVYASGKTWSRTVEVERNGVHEVAFGEVGASEGGSIPWKWVLAGSAGVSLVVGGVLFISGASDLSDADDQFALYNETKDPDEAESLRGGIADSDESAASKLNAGLILTIAAAALGAGAVWMFIDEEDDADSFSRRDGWFLGPAGAGFGTHW